MSEQLPLLELSGFGAAVGAKVVLADVTMRVGRSGVFVLMGPGGSGKSTLMRLLAGATANQPDLRSWGTASYQQRPLGEGPRPALMYQDTQSLVSTVRENLASGLVDRSKLSRFEQTQRLEARLVELGAQVLLTHLEQDALSLSRGLRRLLAVVRVLVGEAALVCFDEPTAQLSEEECGPVLGALARAATTRAVLFVTHHQHYARRLGDQVALLAGGRVQACLPRDEFFSAAAPEVVRRYVSHGSVNVPAPDADPASLAPDVLPPPPLPPAARASTAMSVRGPGNFRWLWPGQLGGLQRPGIVDDLDEDLAALRRLQVDTLVCVEETVPYDEQVIARHGLRLHHVPVVDMGVPTVGVAAAHCEAVAGWLAAGRVVAYHCKAGRGRTGTLLACQLIWNGKNSCEALEQVRALNPKWVQSDRQVHFLDVFAQYLVQRRGDAGQVNPRTPQARSSTDVT